MQNKWTPESWQEKQAAQQPDWPQTDTYKKVCEELTKYPPLVFAGEVQALRKQLADAAQGKGFLVQGGDCAETFILTTFYKGLQLCKNQMPMIGFVVFMGQIHFLPRNSYVCLFSCTSVHIHKQKRNIETEILTKRGPK